MSRAAIRRTLREFVYLATNREALVDRIAVLAFCWAFKHLAKSYPGNCMRTTVNSDYADA